MTHSNELNRRAYDRIATAYAGPEPGEDDPAWRRCCRELFASKLSGKSVLEIGCGPGVDADHLSRLGLDVTATDFCEEFVRITTERYPHLKVARMDMTNPMALVAGTFDGVYGHSCFLHIARDLAPQTLRNLHGLLNVGGILFLSLIESTKVKEYTVPNWGGADNNPADFVCYSRGEMKSLMTGAGFRDVEFHDLTWSPGSPYGQEPIKKRLDERGVSPYQVIGFKQ
jgi:2-polyprenyl-3-methyl-5-hydroxy-6-metoxy-1,4-benzoquinol methylase